MWKLTALFILILARQTVYCSPIANFDNSLSCAGVRLDSPGEPYAKIPVYNQDMGVSEDLDICYAITASEMIDAYRASQGDSLHQLSSPLSIALRARLKQSGEIRTGDNHKLQYMLSGGSARVALDENRNLPICDQRWLDNQAKLIQDSPVSKPADGFILGLFPSPLIAAPNPLVLENSIDRLAEICRQNSLETNYPHVGELEGRMTGLKNIEAIMDQRIKIQHFAQEIHALLDKHSGAAISFRASALQTVGQEDSLSQHEAVIIGRRLSPISGQCEFLVRNSYGPECKNADGTDRYHLPCENGSVWINSADLLSYSTEVSWFE